MSFQGLEVFRVSGFRVLGCLGFDKEPFRLRDFQFQELGGA